MAYRRKRRGKLLLTATLGVATVSLVGCSMNATSGNLVAPPACGEPRGICWPTDGGRQVSPPDRTAPDSAAPDDASADSGASDAGTAQPPRDQDAGDDSDAG